MGQGQDRAARPAQGRADPKPGPVPLPQAGPTWVLNESSPNGTTTHTCAPCARQRPPSQGLLNPRTLGGPVPRKGSPRAAPSDDK